MVITIDGPVASGKSTMARLLAQQLGFYYINSGLLFRAIAYLLVTRYGYQAETLEYASSQELLALIAHHTITYIYRESAQILIDDVDVTAQLKSVAIDRAASLLSVHEAVRDKVLHMQHDIAREHNCVVEGRDAGTVVFPDAELHIFLTAPLEVRAARWQKDQAGKGMTATLEQAMAEITERDERDSARVCAPLRIPQGAVVIDAGERTIPEILTELVFLVKS
jgi:cytidylate kinase